MATGYNALTKVNAAMRDDRNAGYLNLRAQRVEPFAGVAILHDARRADLFRREAFIGIGRVYDGFLPDYHFRFDAHQSWNRHASHGYARWFASIRTEPFLLGTVQCRAPRWFTHDQGPSYAGRIRFFCASSGAAPPPKRNHTGFVGRSLPPEPHARRCRSPRSPRAACHQRPHRRG